MLNEEENTHKTIDNQLKYEEEKEYWQDKILESKMKAKKDYYHLNQSMVRLKEDLDKETQKNEILAKEYIKAKSQLTQLKKSQQTIDDQLDAINAEKTEVYQKNEDLTKQVMSMNDYLHKLNTTDNLIAHFLSFPTEFTKQVYALCTERVNAVLQYKSQMSTQNQSNITQIPQNKSNQTQYNPHENEIKPQPQPPNGINPNYPMIFYPVYHHYQKNNYTKPQ